MSDTFDTAEAADDLHDELASPLPVLAPDVEIAADEQAEDDFDFDFDEDFAAEFADEWEPASATPDLIAEVDEEGEVTFVVEGSELD